MDAERMREIGTLGGCGEIARRLLALVGGTPLLRYGPGGCAVHAAVLVGGRAVHLGEDDGLVEVDAAEFAEACAYDFDLERTSATEEEIEEIVRLLAAEVMG